MNRRVIAIIVAAISLGLPTSSPAATRETQQVAAASAILSVPFSAVNANRLIKSAPSATSGVLGGAIGLWTAGLGVALLREADVSTETIGGSVVLILGVAGLILGVLNVVADTGDGNNSEHGSPSYRCLVTPVADGLKVHVDWSF